MYVDRTLTELGVQGHRLLPSPWPSALHNSWLRSCLWLGAQVDKRLVRTFLATIQVIIQFRHRPSDLLLSELGAYLLSPDKTPAGTKRLSNLLRSKKWSYTLSERFLWHQAETRLAEL